MTNRATLVAATALVAGAIPASADILIVPGQYPTIQSAIDAASPGDEVLVAAGTYNEAIDFLGKAIIVQSLEGRDVTTIDGTDLNDSCVKFTSGEDRESILQGFTVTGGTGHPVYGRGGGINIESSSPTIVDCLLIGNTAPSEGGGLSAYPNGQPLVMGCRFEDNWAQSGAGAIKCGSHGTGPGAQIIECEFITNSSAAIQEYSGSLPARITGCSFDGNLGSAMSVTTSAAGVWIENCTFTGHPTGVLSTGVSDFGYIVITNCTFRQNGSPTSDWPVILGSGTLDLVNSRFEGNVGTAAVVLGGSATCRLTNCAFVGNTVGVRVNFTVPTIRNCTFVANGVAIEAVIPGTPVLSNSILWQNGSDLDGVSQAPIRFCNIEDGYDGIGNVSTDPLFTSEPSPGGDELWGTEDDDYGDLRLAPGSPSTDAGHNLRVGLDAGDLDDDGLTDELTPLDLAGAPRFADELSTVDAGCGISAVIDMGAYETQGEPFEVQLGDLDGSGTVDVVDLLSLLANWGVADPFCDVADLDLDFFVGVNDLLILLAHWS